MPAYEDFRTSTNFAPRELMTSFDMNYASLAGVNMGLPQQNSTEYELRVNDHKFHSSPSRKQDTVHATHRPI